MKSLWTALISALLTGGSYEGDYVLTSEDKEEIAAKVMENVDLYELTEEDKSEIVNTVLERLPETAPDQSGTSENGEVLEYINTIDIQEDCTYAECNTDSEGNPFSLKKVVFYIRIKPSSASTTSTASLYTLVSLDPDADFSDSTSAYRVSMLSSVLTKTQNVYTGCSVILHGIEESSNDNRKIAAYQGSPNNITWAQSQIPSDATGFCKVGISSSTLTTFIGAGSQVKIYGIRA